MDIFSETSSLNSDDCDSELIDLSSTDQLTAQDNMREENIEEIEKAHESFFEFGSIEIEQTDNAEEKTKFSQAFEYLRTIILLAYGFIKNNIAIGSSQISIPVSLFYLNYSLTLIKTWIYHPLFSRCTRLPFSTEASIKELYRNL